MTEGGNDRPAQLVHRIDFADLARYAAVAAGVLYTLGVLVVNGQLATYGLAFMGFGRVEYLFAGGATAVILGTPLAAAHTAYNLAAKRKPWVAALSAVGVAAWIALLLPSPIDRANDWVGRALDVLGGAFSICVNCLSISVVIYAFRRVIMEYGILDVRSVRMLGLGIIMSTVTLGQYGEQVHGLVPREWGGGSKPRVTIVLRDGNAPSKVLPHGQCFGFSSQSLDRVELVAETADVIYVNLRFAVSAAIRRSCKEYYYSAIGIERGQIASIAVLSPKDWRTRFLDLLP